MNAALEKMVQQVKIQQNLLNSRTTLFLLAADLVQEQRSLLAQAVATMDALKAELKRYEPNPQQDGATVRGKTREAPGTDIGRPAGLGRTDQPQIDSAAVDGHPGKVSGTGES
jgi:hypothetical protein